MTTMKLKLVGIAAGTLISINAMAETTLRVATWLPPSHPQNVVVNPTWAKWVEEATEGRVKVVVENLTSHPKTVFAGVEDGIYDAGWTVNAYVPGRFALAGLAEIPGEMSDAETASVALWNVQQEYFNPANEYDGLVLLGQWVHSPGLMHTNFPVNSMADMKDKKIRIGGGMINVLAERMEVTPVSGPATKSYELLQQGVVDGTFLPAGESKIFNLAEVTSHITVFPTALYSIAFSFVANPDFMDSLSDADREAIIKVSGEQYSRLAGKAWQEMHKMGLDYAREQGLTVVELTPDDQRSKDMMKMAEGLDQAWLDSVADRGVDAEAALAAFRKANGN